MKACVCRLDDFTKSRLFVLFHVLVTEGRNQMGTFEHPPP